MKVIKGNAPTMLSWVTYAEWVGKSKSLKVKTNGIEIEWSDRQNECQ